MKTKKIRIIQNRFPAATQETYDIKTGEAISPPSLFSVVGENGESVGGVVRYKNLALTGNLLELELLISEDYFLTTEVDLNNLDKPTAGKKKYWKDI
jgi:hypothetical protein